MPGTLLPGGTVAVATLPLRNAVGVLAARASALPLTPCCGAGRYLGMDTDRDKDMLWIAEAALCAPLPSGWAEYTDKKHNVYFHQAVPPPVRPMPTCRATRRPVGTCALCGVRARHFSASLARGAQGKSTWEHPLDDHFKSMYRESIKKRDAGQDYSMPPGAAPPQPVAQPEKATAQAQTASQPMPQEAQEASAAPDRKSGGPEPAAANTAQNAGAASELGAADLQAQGDADAESEELPPDLEYLRLIQCVPARKWWRSVIGARRIRITGMADALSTWIEATGMPEERAQQVTAVVSHAMDRDGDGKVSFGEFNKFVQQALEGEFSAKQMDTFTELAETNGFHDALVAQVRDSSPFPGTCSSVRPC